MSIRESIGGAGPVTVAILALGLSTACGADSNTRRVSQEGGDGSGGAGTGGSPTGSGGAGTGGKAAGSGGSTGGTGGSTAGTGGSTAGTGGSTAGTGGAVASGGASSGGTGSGGIDAGTGGSEAGTGTDAAAPDAGPTDSGAPDVFVPTTVLAVDFEGTVPANIDIGGGTLTPTQGFAPLGPEGNKFGATFLRGPTGNTVTITFNSLPPHTSISIDFLFAAIDSLDGTGSFPAGDFFRIDLDGTQVFRESFANATPSQIQSYVPPPGVELARHVDLGFSGPGGYYTDSAYNLGADPQFDDVPHTASTAVLTFTLEGEGVQDINDESWAIDNLRVTTGNSPRVRDASN